MSQPEPLTEQQLDEYETAARNAARIGSGIDPAAVLELAAEARRQRDKHKASLRRADEINNELMEEVQRYAAGTERPVLWSVYNDMHLRAADAELTLDRVRRIASRLANHAVGFQDVLDDSDRDPWAKTVGADIADLSAALSPDTAPAPPVAPLAASQPSEVPTEPETATEAPEGLLRGPLPAEDFTGTQPCGHDDYHSSHEWADRPNTWCPGHSHADDQATAEEAAR